MNPYADLHMHTFYSDGGMSPQDVITQCVNIGLKTVAITDHDNVRGAKEARPLAEYLGIELVPAAEFTARWRVGENESDVDLLAYFVDWDHPFFNEMTGKMLADMEKRITLCCELLSEDGFPIDIEDVREQNPLYVGAGSLVKTLIAKRYAPGHPAALAAFRHYWVQVRLSNYHIARVIDGVHACGGVAILAHPRRIACINGTLEEKHIQLLREIELDGIEVYHPSADKKARQKLLALAEKADMVIAGGSDEHAPRGKFTRLGKQPISEEMVVALKERSERYK